MTTNYSYYAIPAAWALSIAPHFYAIGLSKTSNDIPEFTNTCPRQHLAKVTSQEKQTPIVKKFLRAEACNQNSFENLPFFAAAMIAGNSARVPFATMNALAAGWLCARALYSVLYISTTSETWSNLRSAAYLTSIGVCFTAFVKAAKVMNGAL